MLQYVLSVSHIWDSMVLTKTNYYRDFYCNDGNTIPNTHLKFHLRDRGMLYVNAEILSWLKYIIAIFLLTANN